MHLEVAGQADSAGVHTESTMPTDVRHAPTSAPRRIWYRGSCASAAFPRRRTVPAGATMYVSQPHDAPSPTFIKERLRTFSAPTGASCSRGRICWTTYGHATCCPPETRRRLSGHRPPMLHALAHLSDGVRLGAYAVPGRGRALRGCRQRRRRTAARAFRRRPTVTTRFAADSRSTRLRTSTSTARRQYDSSPSGCAALFRDRDQRGRKSARQALRTV
ncbi:hypothetical protein C8J57DRAFT_1324388 [Mycena rebaudengoi]|nr:hypothetical protein C8J57DRAFT_1324388 [Mycena rebaudengoi]